MDTQSPFLPLDAVASALGLPRAWLKKQVATGCIPSLSLNGRRVFDVELVRRTLVERMNAERAARPQPHSVVAAKS